MRNTNKQLERTQLGLPPMQLAESKVRLNEQSSNYMKSVYKTLQKIITLLLVIVFGVGFYVLLTQKFHYTDSDSTAIIVLTGGNNKPNVTVNQEEVHIIFKKKNDTINPTLIRKKRTIDSSIEDNKEFRYILDNFSDEEMQKAREIILKHNKLCNKQNEEHICKDLILQIKAIVDNDKSDIKTDNTVNPIQIPSDDISEQIISDIPLQHHAHPKSLLPLEDTCLLARILKEKHPYLHGLLYADPVIPKPVPIHPGIQDRFVTPETYEESDINTPRRKMHPQDLEIFMRYLTPMPEAKTTQNPINATKRDTECPAGSLPCDTVDTCVNENQWCDGKVDCPDVSDEIKCSCKSRVDKSRLCDGYFDCPLGEDEMGCNGCSDDTFSCEDQDNMNSQSICFTKEQRCNNVANCPNNKDEIECNMLAPSLHEKPLFAVSNTEGYLLRNFKGQWYGVCKNPYMFAHEACRRETGLIIRPPFINVVPIDPTIKMEFLNTDSGGFIHTSDSCFNSSAVYVTCPDLLCGTRVLNGVQMLKENADIENHLFGRNKRFLSPSLYPFPFYGRPKRSFYGTKSYINYLRKPININKEDQEILRKDQERVKRTESRVVGGRPSLPAAWPWMAAMYRDGMFHCGGVVLNQNWILSAAHCVHRFWEHYYEIQVGMLRRFSFSPQEQNHVVTHVIVNRNYNQVDMKNDLSLLRVKPAIRFGRWVRPICLPGPRTAGPNWFTNPEPNTVCTAVGWGATKERGPDPDHLREVNVPVWETCKHREDRTGKEICAGLVEGGKDSCQGDSGGPLLCRNPMNPQQWYMAGIVSHGDGCARKDEPGVYTRVSLYINWIKHNIHSDPLPIIKPKQECPGFKCASGIPKCLPKKRMCDKIIDCLNGEDEMHCNFHEKESNMEENYIQSSFFKETILAEDNSQSQNTTSTELDDSVLKLSDNRTDSIKHQLNLTDMQVSETSHNHVTEEPHDINMNKIINKKNKFSNDMTSASPLEMFHEKSSSQSESDENSIEIVNKITNLPTGGESTTIFQSTTNAEPIFTINKDFKMSTTETNLIDFDQFITSEPSAEMFESIVTSKDTATVSTETPHFIENKNADIASITELFSTTVIINTPFSFETTEISRFDSSSTIRNEFFESQDVQNNKEEGEQPNKLIIELLPNFESSSSISDNDFMNTSTTEKTKVILKNMSNSTQNNTHPHNFKDKDKEINEIENILLSELQPAKIRKKHKTPKEFECRRIFQIQPYEKRCDHRLDCEDGTDEFGCSCVDYISTFNKELICDGIFDCSDGQDELECYTCKGDQFLCRKSETCLPQKYVCDGKTQCPHGEDEANCYALSNGKELFFDIEGKPEVNLEGYITKRRINHWHVLCEDPAPESEHKHAANHICRYLGFSSASTYKTKHVSVKEENLKNSNDKRNRRDLVKQMPVEFVYKKIENNTEKYLPIIEPGDVSMECRNIPKTCMALYVECDNSLFSEMFSSEDLEFSRSAEASNMWPWISKIYVDGNYKCTGVLLNLSWVLIGHSCLWDSLLSHNVVKVVLGSHRSFAISSSPHEQVYDVDAKKDLYRSKVALLHLRNPAKYSSMVKPMNVPVDIQYDTRSICVTMGQDNNNVTVPVFLEENNEDCDLHNRCFKRIHNDSICSPGMTSNNAWSGIISCHTKLGWYPAASFIDSRGECGIGDKIIATDIGYLRNELKDLTDKSLSDSKELIKLCDGRRCGRGKCIPLAQVCDGIKHCEDGNDESDDACVDKQELCKSDPYFKGCDCSYGEIKCKNGKCVSKALFKDGHNDCGDGTDEPEQSTCFEYLSKVMPSRICDGVLHCHDRSDEDPKICKCFANQTHVCSRSSGDVKYCVTPDVVCDGVIDCPNGEDEHACTGLNAPKGTRYGTGEVILRTSGVWHLKCYPKQNHTRLELEAICRRLGFISGHAKQITPPAGWKGILNNNVVLDSFNEIILNDNTKLKLRNTDAPFAKPVVDKNIEKCHPLYIECR